MSSQIATVAFVIGILALFALDRDPKARTSFVLLIPMVWLSIGGSRVVSEWLNPTTQTLASSIATTYMEGNPVDRTVQTVLLTLGMIVLARRGQRLWQLLRANGPILLFFLYCGTSTLWSDYPDVTIRRWIKALGDLVMVLVVLTDRDSSAALKLPARVGFLLLPLSVLLMKYYPALARGFDDITGEPTYTGVTTSKNSLGMICLVFGLGSVWRFLEAYRRRDRAQRTGKLMAAHGVVIGLAMWLFLWAHSMTSLFCFVFAVGLVVLTGFSAVARRPLAVHLLVAVILLGSISVLFLGIGSGLLETVGRDSSLTGRTQIWDKVLRMAENSLLGTGYESFWLGERLERMSHYYQGINQAHNGYIEVYLNLGWTGVVLLAIVLVTGYRNIFDALRRDSDVGRLKLAYFVVGVVMNLTEASFKMMSPVWVLFLLAIIAVPEASPPIVARQAGADHFDSNADYKMRTYHGLRPDGA